MAARIWWTPPLADSVRVVTLGAAFTSVTEGEAVDEVSAETGTGRRTRVVFNRTRTVRYTLEGLTDYARIRDLEALQNHLLRGGHCTVAEDASRCLGTFADGLPVVGSTTLAYTTNLFANYGSGYSPAAGDILCLHGPSPEGLYEEVEVASYTAGLQVTLSEGPLYRWSATNQPWCFVRNKGFWPVLRLREGVRGILATSRRITHALDLDLEVPPGAWSQFTAVPGELPVIDVEQAGVDDVILRSGQYTPPVDGPWSGGQSWVPPVGVPPKW